MTSSIMKDGSPVFEQESDVEVAEVSGLAMIKTLEVFNFQNPTNKTYLMLLSKSYGTYAFGFLENRMLQFQYKDKEKYNVYFERAKNFYKIGKRFGMELAKKNDGQLISALAKGVDAVRKRMTSYARSDVDYVFWLAFNWGSVINLSKDDISVVADLPLVEVMMNRVVQVYPSFYFGAPYLFYGVYYASRPAMLGGSPEKAKENFDLAVRTTGGKSLMVYALQAQFLAVQTMDKTLFNDMIEKVKAGSVDAVPEQRLANALAKDRVKFLKENEQHLF